MESLKQETRLPELLQAMYSLNKIAAIAAACECARWCATVYPGSERSLQSLAKTEAWTRGEQVSLGPFFPERVISEGTTGEIASQYSSQAAFAAALAADESDATTAGNYIFSVGITALHTVSVIDPSLAARVDAQAKMRRIALAKFESLVERAS
jgi:hypothetical protein